MFPDVETDGRCGKMESSTVSDVGSVAAASPETARHAHCISPSCRVLQAGQGWRVDGETSQVSPEKMGSSPWKKYEKMGDLGIKPVFMVITPGGDHRDITGMWRFK